MKDKCDTCGSEEHLFKLYGGYEQGSSFFCHVHVAEIIRDKPDSFKMIGKL